MRVWFLSPVPIVTYERIAIVEVSFMNRNWFREGISIMYLLQYSLYSVSQIDVRCLGDAISQYENPRYTAEIVEGMLSPLRFRTLSFIKLI